MTALAYSIDGACEATGFSKPHLERAIKSGALKAKKSSKNADGEPVGKFVILADALQAYLEGLPDA